MIIDLNELRSKLRLVPAKCDKAFVKVSFEDDLLSIECFKDHSNIQHDIFIREFDHE